ncbi:MAG: hypothetical protein JWO91_1030 [Acidobacteriaceae bacterium]|jgi:hypothetical protein|nr:hypothetical protein [Acidobacteriaceae bacterium]
MARFGLLFALLLVPLLARPQDASTGAIRGSVSDATGSRIPGATIALVNAATGLRFLYYFELRRSFRIRRAFSRRLLGSRRCLGNVYADHPKTARGRRRNY